MRWIWRKNAEFAIIKDVEDTLFLTASEQETFVKMSDALREGWVVQPATAVPQDNPARRAIRLQMLHLKDPALMAFVRRAQTCTAANELAQHLATLKLSACIDADLAELCFALGPQTLTVLIGFLLASASNDEQLQDIEALTVIREALSSSRS